jgi:acyl carrier protein
MDEIGAQEWMKAYVSGCLKVPAASIDIDQRFDQFGIDSASLIGMIGDFEDCLGREIDAELAFRFPTIRTLSAELCTTPDATRN